MVSRNKLTMCRLCLSENECFINIFEVNDWQGYVAADAISDLLQFQVSETDAYPHVVCSSCLTKLTDFKLFKECCQKSKVIYENMFVLHESLEDHKPEMVEFVTVKAEPIDDLDKDNFPKAKSEPVGNEDNMSCEMGPTEAINYLDAADGDEIKQEPMEEIVHDTCGLEFCEEDPLREVSSEQDDPFGTETKILSKRGREKFAHNGFLYTFERYSKSDKGLKFWRCEQLGRCKGRVHTRDGKVVKEGNGHTHDPSAVNIEVASAVTRIKCRAKESVEGTVQILNECVTNLSPAAQTLLPSNTALRKLIKRKRCK